MKRCPQCNRVETDDALAFCRADGTALIRDSGPVGTEAGTVKFTSARVSSEIGTTILPHTSTTPEINRPTGPTTLLPAQHSHGNTRELSKPNRRKAVLVVTLLITVAVAIVVGGYFYYLRKSNRAIESIAVLPFENRSGNADTDYLSDGLADSLIYRLSQLPNLKVSPTSSVMRYRGKETDVAQIAKELEVDAVMSGRLVQRGDDLSISVRFIASIYGALGDKDKAFAELETAFEQRDSWLKWIKVDPMFDPLRDDPRFKELLKRLNMPA